MNLPTSPRQHVPVRHEGGRVLIDNDREVENLLSGAARERVLGVGVRHVGHIDHASVSDVYSGSTAKEVHAPRRRDAAGVDERRPAKNVLRASVETSRNARVIFELRVTAFVASDNLGAGDLAVQAGRRLRRPAGRC